MVVKKKRLVKTVASPPAKKPKANVNSFLQGLNKPKAKSKAKKDDKPLCTLTDDADDPQYFAHKLLRLQQAKATVKAAEGEVKGLEGDLFGTIEAFRLETCESRKGYIGSIKVTAKGLTPPAYDDNGNIKTDDNGNVLSEDGKGGFIPQHPVNPGIVAYYVQNKYTMFDLFDPSSDDELQEEYDGEATLRHECIHAFIEVFAENGQELSFEDADEMVTDRFEVINSLGLDAKILEEDANGNPIHGEALALLQGDILGPFLRNVSKAKPTEAFHLSSNYDPTERALREALDQRGLGRRYKAVLKASGAPKQ